MRFIVRTIRKISKAIDSLIDRYAKFVVKIDSKIRQYVKELEDDESYRNH